MTRGYRTVRYSTVRYVDCKEYKEYKDRSFRQVVLLFNIAEDKLGQRHVKKKSKCDTSELLREDTYILIYMVFIMFF